MIIEEVSSMPVTAQAKEVFAKFIAEIIAKQVAQENSLQVTELD
jgi:archaeosine-15-forming tRNA-guanine transglycosylase